MSTHPAQRFSATAAGYAATMAPALRPVAEEVVRRAGLRADERVLDIGTGTGTAAELARGDGRSVVGIDAAPGMLAIARERVEGVEFAEMDFNDLRFPDGAFDAVVSVHAIHFAEDPVAALREWLRVAAAGGRLSLAVPGPGEAGHIVFFAHVYARHGVTTADRYPTEASITRAAGDAGWHDVTVEADPDTPLILIDEAAFRLWREIGFRGAATDHLNEEAQRALTDDMLAIAPRDDEGRFAIPFGTLYLTGRAAG